MTDVWIGSTMYVTDEHYADGEPMYDEFIDCVATSEALAEALVERDCGLHVRWRTCPRGRRLGLDLHGDRTIGNRHYHRVRRWALDTRGLDQ